MIDVDKIEKLMLLMQEHGVDVVQAEAGTERVSLARQVGQAPFFFPQQGNTVGGPQRGVEHTSPAVNFDSTPIPAVAPSAAPKSALPAGETIHSPFVGTFYRAPNPQSPSFVDLGTRVRKGQALCIVEAMKLMNEIEAECEGEVVAILAENGKPVEFGTPLFIISKGN
jgi:acetyl-CoA carboxylase biotin carboxyl carrier protein